MNLSGTQHRLVVVIGILAMTGCVTPSPEPVGEPMYLPPFETVAILDGGVTDELEARFSRGSTKRGAETGAVSGSAVGMTAALACGPFYLLCALGGAVVGVAVGAGVGAAAGAAEDASHQPTTEQLVQLESILERISEQRVLHAELRDALEARVPPEHRASGPNAAANIQVRLSDVRLDRTPAGTFRLGLGAQVTAQWQRSGRLRANSHGFHFTLDPEPIDYWLEGDGKTFEEAMDDCIDGLAFTISKDLRYKTP